MSILHTINKSSFSNNTIASCLNLCTDGDEILLLEDGVFSAISSAPYAEQLQKLITAGIAVFALSADVLARGLHEKVSSNIKLIDYNDFVNLSIKHRCVQSWY